MHFRCGVYLVCVRGSAVVSTGIQHYRIGEQSELIFLQGSLMQVVEASGDFRVRMVGRSAKIQLPAAQMPGLLEHRQEILQRLGPDYDGVWLDLEGRE